MAKKVRQVSDVTAWQAIERADRERPVPPGPLVYICGGGIREGETDREPLRRYCSFAQMHGVVPLAPGLLLERLQNDRNPRSRIRAEELRVALLAACNQLWVFDEPSRLARHPEFAQAQALGLVIRCFDPRCREFPGGAKALFPARSASKWRRAMKSA